MPLFRNSNDQFSKATNALSQSASSMSAMTKKTTIKQPEKTFGGALRSGLGGAFAGSGVGYTAVPATMNLYNDIKAKGGVMNSLKDAFKSNAVTQGEAQAGQAVSHEATQQAMQSAVTQGSQVLAEQAGTQAGTQAATQAGYQAAMQGAVQAGSQLAGGAAAGGGAVAGGATAGGATAGGATAGGIGGSMASGASTGSMGGPWGAAIGAGIGLLAGIGSYYL